MDNITEIKNLLNAKAKCIWINSYEEKSVIDAIKRASMQLRNPYCVYSHSFAMGLQRHNLTNSISTPYNAEINIQALFEKLYAKTRNIAVEEDDDILGGDTETEMLMDDSNIVILKDFHLLIDNENIKRMFRDVIEDNYINYNAIIVIAPFTRIPIELEKAFEVIDYDTPNESIIETLLKKTLEQFPNSVEGKKIEEDEIHAMIKTLKGLTLEQIKQAVKISIVKNKALHLKEFSEYKISLIKKSNILEYNVPTIQLDEIGGNNAFKKWALETIQAMTPEAKEFGCPTPKGYLALGVPGTAKTILAEAMATEMNVPFLKLDMSKILDSRVGASEQNMAQAIKMVKAVAPCVLLIDEVEKTLSGIGSSNDSDAGTMARSIGSILEFLSSDHGVFVVMTSNDVSQLPPELTRAGRLDAMWYFSIPTTKERAQIFDIHFKKLGRTLDSMALLKCADSSERFTGAEIKEAVKNAVRKSFYRYRKDNNKEVTIEDVKEACKEIIPVAVSSKEKIAYLEAFAKNRANFSSVEEPEDKIITQNKKILSVGNLKK